MEVKGRKELEYINTILYELPKAGFLKRVRGKRKTFTKTELADQISYAQDSHCHRFLNRLKKKEILEENGEKLTASKPVQLYCINRDQLLKEISRSDFYQKNHQLFADILEKKGDF